MSIQYEDSDKMLIAYLSINTMKQGEAASVALHCFEIPA